MAEAATDPFTKVYRTLFSAIADYEPFAEFLRQTMGVDLKSYPEGWDTNLMAGNTPFMGIVPSRFTWKPFHFDTSAVETDLAFSIGIVANDLNIVPINRAKWCILRALVNAGPYLGLPGLVINPIRVLDGSDDAGPKSEWARGSSRWVGLVTVRVAITVPRADFLAGEYLFQD